MCIHTHICIETYIFMYIYIRRVFMYILCVYIYNNNLKVPNYYLRSRMCQHGSL